MTHALAWLLIFGLPFPLGARVAEYVNRRNRPRPRPALDLSGTQRRERR